MDISSNFGVSSYSSTTQTSGVSSSRPPPPPQKIEAVEGELSGYLSEAENAEEAKSFMDDFMSMNLSGEFDAAALVESAPDSLKEYAEEQGVDLEEMMASANQYFEEMSSDTQEEGGRPPPPPPPPQESVEGELSGYLSEIEESVETQDFMALFESMIEAEEFDAEALAESAPDSLIAYAESQDVDLEEMLQSAYDDGGQMSNNMPPGGEDMPPPPPPPQESSNLTDSSAMSYASVAQYGSSETDLMDSLLSALSIKTTA